MSLFNAIYNCNQKYKDRTYYDYMLEAELKRQNYVEKFFKQHPSLSRDCAMAYHCLLFNKELTEEDRAIFTQKLEEIQKREDDKMKKLYKEYRERIEFGEEIVSSLDEMAYYTEEGKDMHEIPIEEKK